MNVHQTIIQLGIPPQSILTMGQTLVITKQVDPNTQHLIRKLAEQNRFTVQFAHAQTEPTSETKTEVSLPKQTRTAESPRSGFFYKLDTNTVRRVSKASRAVQMQLKRDHMIMLMALMSHCGTSNECFPSLKTLQEVTDMSRSHASEMLRGLVQCGLVERHRTGRANVYRIRCL